MAKERERKKKKTQKRTKREITARKGNKEIPPDNYYAYISQRDCL